MFFLYKKTNYSPQHIQTKKSSINKKSTWTKTDLCPPPQKSFRSQLPCTFLPFLATVKRRRKLMPGAEEAMPSWLPSENWRVNDAIPMQVGKKCSKNLTSQNGDEKNAGESQESWQNNTNYILSCSLVQNLQTKIRKKFVNPSRHLGETHPWRRFIKVHPPWSLERRSWIFPSMAGTWSRTCRSCGPGPKKYPKTKGFRIFTTSRISGALNWRNHFVTLCFKLF